MGYTGSRSDRRSFRWAGVVGAVTATAMLALSPVLAGPKGTITVRPLGSQKITIDGDISDWPLDKFAKPAEQPPFPEGRDADTTSANGDHIVFDRQRIGLFNGTTENAFQANPSDFGVTTYFAYDTSFLYILAVFIDDQLRDDRDTSEHGSAGYNNDGFEFFLDARGDSTDCISDDAFPNVDESEPNTDDLQVTVALNATFRPEGAAENVLGARQTVERAGLFDLIGPDKGGPGGLYRDALDALGGPDIAARRFADLRAAGARNPELAAMPDATLTGYAIEMRVPFGAGIPGFTPDHPMGFEIFWRDVDADDDVGAGGGISWASWGQSTEVPCDNPRASLFHTSNWGSLVFDQANFLGAAP